MLLFKSKTGLCKAIFSGIAKTFKRTKQDPKELLKSFKVFKFLTEKGVIWKLLGEDCEICENMFEELVEGFTEL